MDARMFGDFPMDVRRPALLFLGQQAATTPRADVSRISERTETSEASEGSEGSESTESKEMKEKERESGHDFAANGSVRVPLAWKPRGAR